MEREKNSKSATLTVLLNPDFPVVWEDNFYLNISNYHHRFLNVSNVAFFVIVFALFISCIPESNEQKKKPVLFSPVSHILHCFHSRYYSIHTTNLRNMTSES